MTVMNEAKGQYYAANMRCLRRMREKVAAAKGISGPRIIIGLLSSLRFAPLHLTNSIINIYPSASLFHSSKSNNVLAC